ncbi:MAG: cysteine hydrolase [Alphaproteobacteria bacterium]|nr:cysteine hydrolase [Alphaproteobacteria bacterium]
MTSVTLVDRSDLAATLLSKLELRPRQTAMVTIDMHRGHLDPEVATMPAAPEDAARVVANGADALNYARDLGVPVIHVVLVWRQIPDIGSEAMVNPFWHSMQEIRDAENRLSPGRASTINEHNIEGRPGTQIIPDLYCDGDYVIDNKKRLDCFMGTDLDGLLRTLGVANVCLMGINTNTCVLNTAFTAFNKDFRAVVLSDCVASMYGDDLHELGLQNVFRCIGWVVDNDQFKAKLDAGRQLND